MVKRVMQYLSVTKDYGLIYEGKSDVLVGYSDASMSDYKNSLTTCGFVIKLYGDTVAWRTHKQTGVGLSTCEVEYIAMSDVCQEMMSLNNSLRFILGHNLYKMTLYCDNMAALVYVKTGGGNKLRHMVERRFHYVRECFKKDYIYISSMDIIQTAIG